jgi:integrase
VQKQRAIKNGLTESFTEHDLRAKTASDLENLEQAAQLLQHSSSSTTQRIYRRKPDVLLPFKSKIWDES